MKKKNLKKRWIKLIYRLFIVICFIISILCLFKHKETIDKKTILQNSVILNNTISQEEILSKIKSGEINISQNVPIPDNLKEKMEKEAEEKRIAEEQAKIEAEKKAQEEAEAKKKAEELKIAQSKQVTSRGGTTVRKENTQATGTKAEYQAYAKNLCVNTYGWTENDFNCLVKLWERESNWNPNAHNKSSGAHGIPQSLPASKMASEGSDYYTNGKTQIRWGLKYIKNRYGTPANAWAFWQQHKWY